MSVARHTAYNLIGAIAPLAVSLVTVPIYLEVIGLGRYGVLAICWLLIGYFNLFDFGLGRATAQRIAALAEGSVAERNAIFWTGILLSLILSLVAMLAFLPLATISLGITKLTDDGLRPEIRTALPLLVAAVPIGIAQSLLAGTLEGRREFLKVNAILSAGSVATAVLPLLTAIWLGPHLSMLLASALLARACVLVLLGFACARTIPLGKPCIAASGDIRQLLHFGGWITVTNVVSPLLTFADRFAIGVVLGAANVALYVVPFNLVAQLAVLPGALAGAMFPRLASLSEDEGRKMSQRALLSLAFVVTPTTLVMLAGARPFLDAWIGSTTANASAPVAYVLLLGFWANSLARLAHARLQAGGRPDLVAKLHAAEILPYLALLYVAMGRFGLAGAAIAWAVRCTVDALFLNLIDKIDRNVLGLVLLHGMLVLSAVLVMFMTSAGSLSQWLSLAGCGALTAALLLKTKPPHLAEFAGWIRRRRDTRV